LLSTTVVSEPTSASGTSAAGIAYVSLAPGAYPNGVSVSIVNPANGAQGGTQMARGGWDPVAIAADPGDTLLVRVSTLQATTFEYAYSVPPARPPTILRTEPPVRKRDVPLNSVIVVVFSEPIDPATITSQRVQLLQNGQPVAANIEVAPDGLRMNVRPLAPLALNAAYVLAVSQEIADLSGDRLPQGTLVSFNTVESFPVGELAFARGVEIIHSATDGSNPVTLIHDGTRPSWSPDGTQLAFTRPADNSLASWQLCIARSDGSDIRCATGPSGEDILGGNIRAGPSWSPDGRTIAFSAFLHGCPGGECGQFGGQFTSLMLLDALTMEVETLPTPPGVISASWSPDGRRIALAVFGPASGGSGGLAMVNADGTGFQILAERFGSYIVNDVAWSPDGARLALRLFDENACPWYCDSAIGTVTASGTQLRILDRVKTVDQEYFWTRPEWSPDGRYLAYTITTGGACYLHDLGCNDLAVVEVSSARVSRLVANGAYPSWRPGVAGNIRR
jgi:Tol biopolymer transport system component